MTANAGHLALIEILAAEINLTSQTSSMTTLSQTFPFERTIDMPCDHRLQAVI